MAVTLTPFGKEIRKLRIERGETMMEMANRIQKSPSYLSSVETGRKSIPATLINQIVQTYGLDDRAAQRLQDAANASASVFKIAPTEEKDQELVAAFARKFDSLTDEQRKQLFNILMD